MLRYGFFLPALDKEGIEKKIRYKEKHLGWKALKEN